MDDSIVAEEISKQITSLKPCVETKGVLGYLNKDGEDKRADVNKAFLASTIRGVNSHNRRQEEDKCWALRRMERSLDEARDRRRSRKRSRSRSRDRKRRHRPSRSRSSSRHHTSRSGIRHEEKACKRSDRSGEDEDERSYWARKKAEKTQKLWENLHSEGTVSVENAPAFSSEGSDDDDVKPAPAKASSLLGRDGKKHKKHKKRKTSGKKRRS